jgi:hypothetical protein
VTTDGAETVGRRHLFTVFWARHRSRWTLPLVIIVIIIIVAAVDHIGDDRISQVDRPPPSGLVATNGGSATVAFDQPMAGFNPNTAEGAVSGAPTVLASVLPSAYIVNPQKLAVPNSALLQSVEVIRPAPDHFLRDQSQGRVVGWHPGHRPGLHLCVGGAAGRW